ncbi:MAG: DUF5683 domain-containing protein [Nitrospiraceae bacterium]
MREWRNSSRPAIAAVLSALLPGLGQFYNRQWGKGLGFLIALLVVGGVLTSSADLQSLQQSVEQGILPQNIGRFFLLLLLLLIIAIWSIVDASRWAKRSHK